MVRVASPVFVENQQPRGSPQDAHQPRDSLQDGRHAHQSRASLQDGRQPRASPQGGHQAIAHLQNGCQPTALAVQVGEPQGALIRARWEKSWENWEW
ncbi:hypothetical protein E1301_Tti019183 [Triplophysa tibetana]|uniref:Uncharacterized protein n=1 Tax=Triplophysa tibetana TaxID=1572043 RepID=A0A5A9P5Y1_9TELE|nr:hypothetical protein E1301_Tti019183 [Triplophysa tibetana]